MISLDLAITVAAAPSLGLAMTLAFADGSSLSFSQAQANDIGDYVGPFVRQRCLRQRQGPWTVYFRPDADGSRQEVVVEYGCDYTVVNLTTGYKNATAKTLSGLAPTDIVQPYTATISGGALAQPVTVNVPYHWWAARWRWQSSVRPFKRTAADLLAIKAALPMSAQAVWNTPAPLTYSGAPWTGPMGTGKMQTGFGTPGERPEIGPVNEWEAYYLLTSDITNMVNVAEAAGSISRWVRDVATGAIVNVQDHPYMGLNSDAIGSARIPMSSSLAIADPLYPYKFRTEVSHWPSMAFLTWLLTDDPYHLESCQMIGHNAMQESNYHNVNNKLPGFISNSETRGWAFGMRDLFRMAGFCPASPPSWLLPQSYWKQCVADNLVGVTKAINGDQTLTYVKSWPQQFANFHNWCQGNFVASFMQDYLEHVVGWAQWTGLFPEWSAAVNWLAYPRISMMNNRSVAPGWDRRWPVPYDFTPPTPVPANWDALWAWYASTNGSNSSNWSAPSTWPADGLAPKINFGYLSEGRSALAALALAGISGARAAHDWLLPQMPAAALAGGGVPSTYKFAVWPG